MGDKTGIEWTDATWNPIRGCSRVSEGCRHCYAEGQAARIQGMDRGRGVPEGEGAYDGLLAPGGQWNGKIRVVPHLLDQPLRWRKPRRIFVNSMSDLFHESVPNAVIDDIFQVMALCRQHTFQILTKRPERMLAYFRGLEEVAARHAAKVGRFTPADVINLRFLARYPHGGNAVAPSERVWPLPNVQLGISAEDQATYDKRTAILEQAPAAVRWVSLEPMLGGVNANLAMCLNGHGWVTPVLVNNSKDYGCPHCMTLVTRCSTRSPGPFMQKRPIDWIVVGGESGPKARPMHPDWVRSLRDQCAAAGIPFMFKQWGEWAPAAPVAGGDLGGDLRSGVVQHLHAPGNPEGHFRKGDVYVRKTGKKAAGRLLDGIQHDGYPKTTAICRSDRSCGVNNLEQCND